MNPQTFNFLKSVAQELELPDQSSIWNDNQRSRFLQIVSQNLGEIINTPALFAADEWVIVGSDRLTSFRAVVKTVSIRCLQVQQPNETYARWYPFKEAGYPSDQSLWSQRQQELIETVMNEFTRARSEPTQ